MFQKTIQVEELRCIFELAYLQAWGPKGNSFQREQWQIGMDYYKEQIGDVVKLTNDEFFWRDPCG